MNIIRWVIPPFEKGGLGGIFSFRKTGKNPPRSPFFKGGSFILFFFLATQVFAVSSADRSQYQDYINSTKSDIARDTELEFKYQEAVELMNEKRFAEASSLLEQILTRDPTYRNAAKLRADIQKMQTDRQKQALSTSIREKMHQGDAARRSGNRIMAVNFYKEALSIDPTYASAQKKIQEINGELARKQFEAGYIHYNRNDLEDALDTWSEAIALDPTLKQKGLLTLMTKVEKTVRQDQVAKLAQQGYDQFSRGEAEPALDSYNALLRLSPRHEEARRMSAKLSFKLGQASLSQAKTLLARKDYAGAKAAAEKTIAYNWEVPSAQEIKAKAEKGLLPPPPAPPSPAGRRGGTRPAPPPSPSEPPPPAPPPAPVDPEKAMQHYRQILAAVRVKDFHRALEECEKARQLDSSNERIYVACERARQEWENMKSSGAPGGAF